MPNFALNDTHTNRFSTDGGDRLAVAIAAAADAEYLCREAAVPVITMEDQLGIGIDTITLFSYDETTDLTGSLSQLLTNTPPTAIGASTSDQAEAALRCKAFLLQQICLLPLLPLVMKKVQKPKACRERGLNSATTLKNTPCPSTNSSGAEETTSYKPKCFFSVIFYPTLFLWAGVLRAPN